MSLSTTARSLLAAGILIVSMCACAGDSDENPSQQKPIASVKVNVALIALYEEYREYLANGSQEQEFESSQAGITVIQDRVIIDARARDDAERLRQDFIDLGAVNVAAAGNIVSCQLPILAIAQLPSLDSLQSVRPAYATTR